MPDVAIATSSFRTSGEAAQLRNDGGFHGGAQRLFEAPFRQDLVERAVGLDLGEAGIDLLQ
jgi:hypothetical protein